MDFALWQYQSCVQSLLSLFDVLSGNGNDIKSTLWIMSNPYSVRFHCLPSFFTSHFSFVFSIVLISEQEIYVSIKYFKGSIPTKEAVWLESYNTSTTTSTPSPIQENSFGDEACIHVDSYLCYLLGTFYCP